MKRIEFIILIFLLSFSFVPNTSFAEEFTPYVTPSIKNAFCGAHINAVYCKCAFHNEYCDSAGMTQSDANNFVQGAYSNWLNKNFQTIKSACQKSGGLWLKKGSATGCLVCSQGEVLLAQQCQKISELCSDDPNITYDVRSNQCSCNKGYELKDDGDGPVCEVVKEILIETSDITPNKKSSYLADGKNEVTLKIKGTYVDTEREAPLRFEIKYSTTGNPGEVVSVRGNQNDGYTVTYRTKNLTSPDITSGKDVLYIFYYSGLEKKELYKTYDINLYSSNAAMAEISKAGFKTTRVHVPFASDQSEVYVYVKDEDDKKTPVNGAKIEYAKYFSGKTDKNGLAKIESPETMDSAQKEILKTEVFLELDDTTKRQRNESWQKLSELISKNVVSSDVVKDFVLNFSTHLAATNSDTETFKLVAGIKQINYSLFYIKQGTIFGDDISDSLANSIGGAIWDLTDLLKVFDRVKNPLSDFVNKKTGGLNIELSDGLSQTFKMDFAKNLESTIGKSQQNIMATFINGIRIGAARASVGTNKFSPNWIDKLFREVFAEGLQQGMNEWGDKLSGGSISSSFDPKGRLAAEFKKLNGEVVADVVLDLENKIQNKSFNAESMVNMETAKLRYTEFSNQYLSTNKIEYNTTMTKQWFELGMNIVGKAAKILYPSTAGEIVDLIDNVYKGVRSGVINNIQLVTWMTAYSKNQDMIQGSVNAVLADSSCVNPFARLGTQAHAAGSVDVISNLYKSKLDRDEVLFSNAIDYSNLTNDIEFYSNLKTMTELLVLAEPNNASFKNIDSRIAESLLVAEKEVEQIVPELDSSGLLDPNYGESGVSEFWYFVAVMVAVFFAWRRGWLNITKYIER